MSLLVAECNLALEALETSTAADFAAFSSTTIVIFMLPWPSPQ